MLTKNDVFFSVASCKKTSFLVLLISLGFNERPHRSILQNPEASFTLVGCVALIAVPRKLLQTEKKYVHKVIEPSARKESVKSHNLWHFSHELSLRARLRGLNRSQKSCDLQSLTLYTPKWAIIGCPFLHCSLHQWFLCTLVKNANLRTEILKCEFNKTIFNN